MSDKDKEEMKELALALVKYFNAKGKKWNY